LKIRSLLLALLASASGALFAADLPSTLTGTCLGARSWEAERGVAICGSYTSEVLGNVRGGRATGAVFAGLLQIGTDLDLEKLVAWRGATLHATALYPHGDSLSAKYISNFAGVSSIDAYDSWRLYEAWVEQTAFDGRFALRVGFLAADVDFCVTEFAAPFINSAGTPPALTANFPMSAFPYSALGVRLRMVPAACWSVQFGAYDGNVAPGVFPDPTPGAARSNEFNKHGTQFALRADEGAMLFAEIGWKHGDAGAIKVGGTYHTDRFGDIRDFTLAALGSRLAPTEAGSFRGNYAFYVIAEHDLWHEPGSAHDGLGGFIDATFAPADRNFFRHSAQAGLVYHGLFQSDARDVLGLAVDWLGLSPQVRSAHREAGGEAPHDETVLELTYQYAVTPWCTLQPDVQWVLHSGGTSRDALVIGLRATLTF
jgi:porin